MILCAGLLSSPGWPARSGATETQQSPDSKEARAHYQAGLAALERNDLDAAEEEIQAAAKLAPKDALVFYKLAVIQARREEWKTALKNIDAARALGLPKNLDEEALKLAADIIMKQLQTNVHEGNKKYAWLNQLLWLDGKNIFAQTLNRESECARDYHSIYNVLTIQPDYDKGVLSGTLTLHETHRTESTGAGGCQDAPPPGSQNKSQAGAGHESKSNSKSAPKIESYREAVLRVVVKPDDGINDGKIRMFATLESCKGNACDALSHEFEQGTAAYIVEKTAGNPVISISVLSDGDKDGRLDEQFKKERRNRS